MKSLAVAIALLLPITAFAGPVTLSPANPQPNAVDMAPGLSVIYAYPKGVRHLADAKKALKKGRKGQALRGLSYEDTKLGDLTLTSSSVYKVAAQISGFVQFRAAGNYTVNVISNDGIVMSIGGKQVALYDEIHGCEPAGEQEVVVPKAGWYAVEATYFQKKGTSCLLMDWDVGGSMAPVPDSVFGHLR